MLRSTPSAMASPSVISCSRSTSYIGYFQPDTGSSFGHESGKALVPTNVVRVFMMHSLSEFHWGIIAKLYFIKVGDELPLLPASLCKHALLFQPLPVPVMFFPDPKKITRGTIWAADPIPIIILAGFVKELMFPQDMRANCLPLIVSPLV
jgi:hypothetical protein